MSEVYSFFQLLLLQIDMSTGSIDGLRVIENFITPEEESELISEIDNREWGGNGIP